jgi:uncharacterized lipoprotein YbaY
VLEFPADVAMSPGLKRLLSGMMIKDPAKRMRLEQVITVTSVTVVAVVVRTANTCMHARVAVQPMLLAQHAEVHGSVHYRARTLQPNGATLL